MRGLVEIRNWRDAFTPQPVHHSVLGNERPNALNAVATVIFRGRINDWTNWEHGLRIQGGKVKAIYVEQACGNKDKLVPVVIPINTNNELNKQLKSKKREWSMWNFHEILISTH